MYEIKNMKVENLANLFSFIDDFIKIKISIGIWSHIYKKIGWDRLKNSNF